SPPQWPEIPAQPSASELDGLSLLGYRAGTLIFRQNGSRGKSGNCDQPARHNVPAREGESEKAPGSLIAGRRTRLGQAAQQDIGVFGDASWHRPAICRA